MCKVNCEVTEGIIPSEKVARIRGVDGKVEEVAVPHQQIAGGNMLIASEVSRVDDRVLVELPRESASGKWRVWVSTAQVG